MSVFVWMGFYTWFFCGSGFWDLSLYAGAWMRSSGGRWWQVDCCATVGGLLGDGCGRWLLVLAYVVWTVYGDVGFVVVSGVYRSNIVGVAVSFVVL